MGLLTLRPPARARCLAALVAATLAGEVALAPSAAWAETADAKTSLANADKAARAKDWAKAQAEYEAAFKAQPSAEALEGVANAHLQQKHDVEAYSAYDDWLKTYGAKAPKPKKAAIEAKLKDIATRTGTIAVTSNEPGADVTVDDKALGKTPLAAPIRLITGPHRVRITKDGFVPFDQVPNVAAGATTTVDVKLETQSTKGRLNVREKSGKALRILVDGVDVGEAPWNGELPVGSHDVVGRSTTLATAPEKVTIEPGKTRDVELVASATTATLKVTTSDGKGLVYLDGKLVGEGSFSSEIPAGTHVLRITRDGYDPFEEPITLKDKETLARSVTLKLSSKIATAAVQKERRSIEGIYGGIGLLATYLTSGMQSSMQKTCEGDKPAELTSCDGTSGGFGGALTGFLGYHWDPVGVELYGGAQYDQTSPTLNWAASSVDPGIGPDPARTESFGLHRVGGFAALRVRLTFQSEKLRFSIAGGVGLAARSIFMGRETTQTGAPQNKDTLLPAPQGYSSPIVSLEPSLAYRLGATTALSLGFAVLVESPSAFGQTPTTKKESNHYLGLNGLSSPEYQLASGTQVFLGPVLGIMFGP